MDVSVDPVPQVLRPSGFGAGVTAGAQHRDGHLGLANFARPWAVTEPSAGRDPGTSFPDIFSRYDTHAEEPRATGAAICGKGRSTNWRHSPLDEPVSTPPTADEGLRSFGSSTPGQSPPSLASTAHPSTQPLVAETDAAPKQLDPDRLAVGNSTPPLPDAADSAACSCSAHHLRLHSMWATIPVESKCRPHSHRNHWITSNGIAGPFPPESVDHIDRNRHERLQAPCPSG
jgi:hypothetical protein